MTDHAAIRFRSASNADVAMIRDLVRDAYQRWVLVVGREPLPMVADYDKAVAEHRFDIAEVSGHVVGLIETMLDDDHLWIENVAVKPAEQGKGYGRLLLALAEKLALEAGRHEVRLLTNEAFAANVSLYGKLGYVVTTSRPFKGGFTLYMSKTLHPAATTR
ncbi:GNAT family N-acetyltransferase [Neorhizobium sp. NCHU2750]|uniref:GNAT family N-acetyltransferase n=1 Tax=Neorhizobium sp. NCHU2750 TaxID=1825976 RepID=UPI000E729228|nr:GCN5 family acetyltransferase [Neorhizobium sp. NCHU2750]